MKARSFLALSISAFLTFHGAVLNSRGQGTAFTYQGQLVGSNGSPVTATVDMKFNLYNLQSGGAALGTVEYSNVPVTNGLFTQQVDFGPTQAPALFNGQNLWLEVNDVSHGVVFARQPITPTPYAIYASNSYSALNANGLTGNLPAAQLSGTIANSNLPASITLSGTITAGSFVGNGAGLTNLPVSGGTTGGLMTNLVPPGAVFDANGNYAVSGITVGATYFIHLGGLADFAGATNGSGRWAGDAAVYYSNNTAVTGSPFGAVNNAIVVAGSNTFYIAGGGPRPFQAAGSNVWSRIYFINTNNVSGTNTIAGNFNGTINGIVSGNLDQGSLTPSNFYWGGYPSGAFAVAQTINGQFVPTIANYQPNGNPGNHDCLTITAAGINTYADIQFTLSAVNPQFGIIGVSDDGGNWSRGWPEGTTNSFGVFARGTFVLAHSAANAFVIAGDPPDETYNDEIPEFGISADSKWMFTTDELTGSTNYWLYDRVSGNQFNNYGVTGSKGFASGATNVASGAIPGTGYTNTNGVDGFVVLSCTNAVFTNWSGTNNPAGISVPVATNTEMTLVKTPWPVRAGGAITGASGTLAGYWIP